MVVITAITVVMTGCTRATDAPPPTSTDGASTSVVDAGAELGKLPDVERFLEQAIAQVRQKYPDQVPDDLTTAAVMGELHAIDSHVGADGVLDYATAKSDPAITTDTLDPYARTYRTLGGELTGTGTTDADATGVDDADAASTTLPHASVVRLDAAEGQDGSKEDDPRVGYSGPRQFVSDRPEWVDEYKPVGNEILQGKVLYFESEYSLARLRFTSELDGYLQERIGDDQTVITWGGIMDGPFGACIVDTEVYHELVFEQGAEDSEACLTRTAGGSTVPDPLLPLDSPVPESAVAVEADVEQLIIQELWPIVKDFIGLADLEKCFTEADILACVMTLLNVLPVGKAIKALKAIPAVVRAVEKIVTFVATKGKKLPVAVPAGCFASFAGSTPVLMADGTHKPIRDVRPGDDVHATDPVSGVSGPRRVLDTFVHRDALVELRLASGDKITTTADHPFWSSSDHTFEDAKDLAPGEKVLSADGTELAVGGIDAGAIREGAAYNLAVLDLHTYHVGDAEVLVHNSGCLAVLKNWKPKSFRYGDTTLVLQRGGMQHILERHHPTYFDPEQARQKNDFFRESRTVDDIVGLIDQVVRQRTDELAAIARRSNPEQQRGEVEATIDGVTYLLAVRQGGIRSFYPVGGE
ncbi:polymorphic toxin-type HINT domain-containing protein [Promicromonospora sp. NPDC090134]|uniref:polymorphic toxin-type HINT domain-containing protein n=1 Tax=Promicromonospora sp. NPDC090134 TaxID=3364408 RepID=UPI0038161445